MTQPIICPQCGGETSLSKDNHWRPFCSERCKMIDLNGWFEEEHTMGEAVESDDLS